MTLKSMKKRKQRAAFPLFLTLKSMTPGPNTKIDEKMKKRAAFPPGPNTKIDEK